MRTYLALAALAAIAVFASACATLVTPWNLHSPTPRNGDSHHLTVIHDAAPFADGSRIVNGEIAKEPHWLALNPAGVDPAALAAFESPVVRSAIRFNEVLLSWNADVPAGCGARFELRIADSRTGDWSPWLYVGRWGADIVPGERVQKAGPEYIDIDYLRSSRRHDLAQYRIVTARERGAAGADPVRIRRVALTFSDRAPLPEDHPRIRPVRSAPAGAPNWVQPLTLDVPFRSQKLEKREIAGRICSPTSLAMVMAYRGVDAPVAQVAERAFDADFNIYGNWPSNVQAAYTFGVPGYLTRVNDWAEARSLLARGQPLIASIQADRGDLRSAPYRRTNGHLLVIRGFDENGDVLVNDPAASTPEAGAVTYARHDMQRVWLERTAGTTYVLLPPE